MQTAAEPIRVNYGCGDTRLDGFVGVDVRPCRGADHVLPAWDTSPFETDSVSEIFSRHMLEHLDPDDARRALRAWLGILKPGGLLRLIVPDLIFHSRQLLGEASSWSTDPTENFEHAIKSIYGWRHAEHGGDRADAHRWGYTWRSLSTLLCEVGYTGLQRVSRGPDTEPWHLHVIARRPAEV